MFSISNRHSRLCVMIRITVVFCLTWPVIAAEISEKPIIVTPEGSQYRLVISEHVAIQVRDQKNNWQPLTEMLYIEGFSPQWKLAYRISSLEEVEPLKLSSDGAIRLAGKWRIDGEQKPEVSIQLDCYPTYIRMSGYLKSNDQRQTIDVSRLIVTLSKPYQIQKLLTDTPPDRGLIVVNRYDDKPYWTQPYVELPLERKVDPKFAGQFDVLLAPWFGQEPVIDQAYFKEKQSQPSVAMKLLPSQRWNVFFPDEVMSLTLWMQNNSDNLHQFRWTIQGRDFEGNKLFTLPGHQALSPGQSLKRQVILPVRDDWRGHMSIDMDVQDGIRQYTLKSSIGRIPSPERQHKQNSIFGMQNFVWLYRTDQMLDVAQALGVHWMRHALTGMPIEKPVLDDPIRRDAWVKRHDQRQLELYPEQITDYPVGKFRMTEQINEINCHVLGAQWAEIFKIYSLQCRAYDPDIWVGTPATAGVDINWYEDMAANGVWDYADIINVHLHCFPYAPEVDNRQTSYFWLASRVRNLVPLMEKYGYRPVADTEQGYLELDPNVRVENYPYKMISEPQAAAAYMVRSYLEAMAYGLVSKQWFLLNDYGGFGIFNQNQPRVSAIAYAVMTKELDGAKYRGELKQFTLGSIENMNQKFARTWFGMATEKVETKGTLQGDLGGSGMLEHIKPEPRVRAFEMPDGQAMLVAWTPLMQVNVINKKADTPVWRDQEIGEDKWWNGKISNTPPSNVKVNIHVGVEQVEIVDLMGNRRNVSTPEGNLSIELGENPIYIHGVSEDVLLKADKLSMKLFPSKPPTRNPSNVVACLIPQKGFPRRTSVYDDKNIAAELKHDVPVQFVVRLSNFGSQEVKAKIRLIAPKGWKVSPKQQVVTVKTNSMDEIEFLPTEALFDRAPGMISPVKNASYSKPFFVTAKGKCNKSQIMAVVTVDNKEVSPSVLNVSVK